MPCRKRQRGRYGDIVSNQNLLKCIVSEILGQDALHFLFFFFPHNLLGWSWIKEEVVANQQKMIMTTSLWIEMNEHSWLWYTDMNITNRHDTKLIYKFTKFHKKKIRIQKIHQIGVLHICITSVYLSGISFCSSIFLIVDNINIQIYFSPSGIRILSNEIN